jgi:hypothetical protein
VPGEELFGISGVESGKAAPLVGGPPGTVLHTVVDEMPSGDGGDMVPIVLPPIGVVMVPNGVAVIIPVDAVIADVLPASDVETVPGTLGTVMDGEGRGGGPGGDGAG